MYQALYRKWRPQTFADVIGQQHVTDTLRAQLQSGRLSHAYLFTGTRGTGKTTCAKILARAVNCEHPVNGDPCNECEICKAITAGRLNDVIEIDAASNNGVEEIRDIRDKVKYAPTQADYKVYIIDEVHMLSTSAFNALLKTLEEPPANVVFILATTDPHKIPATIISRTQRFDFKRITSGAILERMEYILKQKQFEYDEKALNVIARAAEGGMRDALSILDQVLSFGDNKVTLDNALPELMEGYKPEAKKPGRPEEEKFDPYRHITEQQHRIALEAVFGLKEEYGYKELENALIKSYTSIGVKLNHQKAVPLITMLRNKRMIVQENGRKYTFMPDFHY